MARYTSIRTILELAAVMKWKIHQMDLKKTFLNGVVEEEVYVVLWRKLPMAWGNTTDGVTAEINPFPYAGETKYLTLKDLETYLIPYV